MPATREANIHTLKDHLAKHGGHVNLIESAHIMGVGITDALEALRSDIFAKEMRNRVQTWCLKEHATT